MSRGAQWVPLPFAVFVLNVLAAVLIGVRYALVRWPVFDAS